MVKKVEKRVRTAKASKEVKSFKHDKDKRVNIPTRESEGLVSAEESAPKRVQYARRNSSQEAPEIYTRNGDKDPQLVWRGKDEEDARPLEVDAAPIYVQEKIMPQAIINDLIRQTRKGRVDTGEDTADLFHDFNGLADPNARLDFYKHSQNWTNRMILGDSREVMASLDEKEGLRGKVQCIYVDPPYGIKFSSNWQPKMGRPSGSNDETRETEVIRAYRDIWQGGVNSYLSYLRDRLTVAHQLLAESGSVFMQIGDGNVHLVRCLMDEVFGGKNVVSHICFRTAMTKPTSGINNIFDHILWYAKNKDKMKYRPIFIPKGDVENDRTSDLMASVKQTKYVVDFEGKSHNPEKGWRVSKNGMQNLIRGGRVKNTGTLRFVRYASDFAYYQLDNIWDKQMSEQNKVYVVQTSEQVIQRCLLMSTDPGDLVIDPTCGSGTTAYIAEKWGRRWITIDTSRVAIAIARNRLMGASFDYYFLQDSKEGADKNAELDKRPHDKKSFTNDVRQGFVLNRVPHIDLKSIANNSEIGVIHERYQEQIESLCTKINETSGSSYAEHEIPDNAVKEWGKNPRKAHEEYILLRDKRMAEIKDSIVKSAESRVLVDQPVKIANIVRVTGAFTVESLSPHRILPVDISDEELESSVPIRPRSESENENRFLDTVLENLKAVGVQSMKKSQRIEFITVEPCQRGRHIQFDCSYMENGREKKAAICVGPEYGTVNRSLMVNAAREASSYFDTLVVLGFAFESYADENLTNLGRINVIRARMNNDLHMSDRLKSGGGNLFVAFGEPDIEVRELPDSMLEVEILGIDIFDPTTGETKADDTASIACWFIDINYNEESFFVRHAYFCGDKEECYKKLKRALNTDISCEVWESLHSTISRPFAVPESGYIAVKAINYFGDEVMRVFSVDKIKGGKEGKSVAKRRKN